MPKADPTAYPSILLWVGGKNETSVGRKRKLRLGLLANLPGRWPLCLGSFRRAQDGKRATQGSLLAGSFRPTQDSKLATQGSSLAGSFRHAQDGRLNSSGVALLLVGSGVGGFMSCPGLSLELCWCCRFSRPGLVETVLWRVAVPC